MAGVWSAGDIVEVLDKDGCWRESMINEVMEDGYYFIWVFDSAHPVIVEKSSVRARQEWKDNKKVADQSVHVLSKSLKRSSPDYVAYPKSVQKRRLVDKEVDLDAYSFTGKVENVQITTDGKTKTIGDSNGKASNSRKHELDDCSSTVSSVASCSISSAAIPADRLLSHSSAGCSSHDHSVSLSSDGESYSHDLGEEEEVSSAQFQRGDALKAHELKLHGYRGVLELLYSSGPLSWEQEIELTKLRLKLSVSNDEHLTELRRLKSSRNLGLS
ncbi:uncharacterized protein LOC104887824 [Beta vulgaris subsp. vulgaris]|uniref:uncharacterized protein LOC104887824 n=1 Tax=Beta vulgaris subsp. vulgaris TaxID=3555 RepID=UPI00053F712D|nr:uncharacterized protein LOC104887824 [Beta vulgaris subsp. vulgaris]